MAVSWLGERFPATPSISGSRFIGTQQLKHKAVGDRIGMERSGQ
jgi:hypothetical protein